MGAPSFAIVFTEERPVDVSKRAWERTISKNANEDTGEFWHKEMLPGHFKPGAAQKYGHRDRSPKYLKNKERLAERGYVKRVSGQLQDNVFTGRTRADLKRAKIVKGFPTRVTITMIGPKHLTTRFWKANQPDKVAEITAVTSDDEAILARYNAKRLAYWLENHRANRYTRKTKY